MNGITLKHDIPRVVAFNRIGADGKPTQVLVDSRLLRCFSTDRKPARPLLIQRNLVPGYLGGNELHDVEESKELVITQDVRQQ
jgi:hypothetical protein